MTVAWLTPELGWSAGDRRHFSPFVMLNGGNLENKGDHLMLLAVLSRVRQWGMHGVWTTKLATYAERAGLGVHQRVVPRTGRPFVRQAERWLLSRYGEQYGIVPDYMCRTVLDFRGYAFGDCWQLRHARGAIAEFRRWASAGSRIILLPQAFGPFRSEEWRAVVRELLPVVHRCFARDIESLEAIRECGVGAETIQVVPDLTFGFGNQPQPDDEFRMEGAVAFIPNKWMRDRVPPEVAAGYVAWMQAMARLVAARGLAPVLIPMSRTLDKPLVAELMAGPSCPFRLLSLDDPLDIKQAIGRSSAVVTSRFHGLVSALSSGRPALATAWTHKYRLLMDEFGLAQGTVSNRDIAAGNPASAEILLRWIHDESLITRLRATAGDKASAVDKMWSELKAAAPIGAAG